MKIATTEATSLSSGSILGFRAGEEERIRALVLNKDRRVNDDALAW